MRQRIYDWLLGATYLAAAVVIVMDIAFWA